MDRPYEAKRDTAPPVIPRWLRWRWLQHLLFWCLSFIVLLRIFAYQPDLLSRVDWVYTLLFHLSLVCVVYLNIRVLIPRVLGRQRHLGYLAGWLALIAAGTWLNQATFRYLADRLFPGYYFISYYTFRDVLLFTAVYGAVSTLLKLSKGWFRLHEQSRRLARLEREKIDAELQTLRGQLDPHFLFNSLNNLYSLALDQDARTPGYILKLSAGMRYMLYDCREPVVPLAQELAYIRDYLDLQRLRHGEELDVRLEQDGEAGEQRVAPLLFIPFIENGFKHGVRSGGQPSFVHLRFDIQGSTVSFRMRNSRARREDVLPMATGGIGQDNVRRRLQLLYPGKHKLHILAEEDCYSVTLQIDLS